MEHLLRDAPPAPPPHLPTATSWKGPPGMGHSQTSAGLSGDREPTDSPARAPAGLRKTHPPEDHSLILKHRGRPAQ